MPLGQVGSSTLGMAPLEVDEVVRVARQLLGQRQVWKHAQYAQHLAYTLLVAHLIEL
jgi:hypothetical protein